MAPRICNRCGNCHIGCLIYAPLGFRVLFRNEWEEMVAPEELERIARENAPTTGYYHLGSLREFLEMSN